MYLGTHVGYPGLTSQCVSELWALPLGLAASSHRICWEATVRGRSSVCCFRLNCAECRACVRTSPSALVYLTSPRFKLIVDTLLSYEFSFQTGSMHVENFSYPLSSCATNFPDRTIHQYLPIFNINWNILSDVCNVEKWVDQGLIFCSIM